ncbi:tetratricopeptide repeat protein [Synechocystis sp. PCC 7509]|uniref:tetratricopeptide repeat protein n=1 Tax=Synechocystis sp. PCC 7509 TaxID=927677 RepID=UPI0002ACDEB4|nr:tetratricopeptide repeat protein [Synechocystis sp. PCC 7509]
MTESLEIAKKEYIAGVSAFEKGQYRESVQRLEKASALVNRNSGFGGKVLIWLVTAYEAAGQLGEAIALCEQIKKHPDAETSSQGKRLLYIMQAPQLKRPTEWLTQIPDLAAIADNTNQTRLSNTNLPRTAPKPRTAPDPVDLSQVNTKDNQFIWVSLLVIGLTIGLLYWGNT